MDLTQVLLKPVVTEKTTLEEINGRYTFTVNPKATKIDIKNAFKRMYGVEAKKVTVRPTPKKTRLVGRGRVIQKRQRVKKATIALAPGIKIDLYKFTKVKAKK